MNDILLIIIVSALTIAILMASIPIPVLGYLEIKKGKDTKFYWIWTVAGTSLSLAAWAFLILMWANLDCLLG